MLNGPWTQAASWAWASTCLLAQTDPKPPDSLIIEVAKQVPALLVLCFLVVKFLRAIESQQTSFGAAIDKLGASHNEQVVGMVKAHATATTERINQFVELKEVVKVCSARLEENSRQLGKGDEILDGLKDAMGGIRELLARNQKGAKGGTP